MEANSRMREITGNLRRDMKDLLGESAHIVTGFFKRGVCTVRAVADKWRTFTQDISAAVDELMKPPFLEGGPDAPLPTIEEGAEPIVTVTGSIDRNFPIGKQMPLSQANVYVAEMDAAYREEELPAQPVKLRIDYIRDGRTDCYCLPLHIGAGGSLLEQMERHLETYRADPNRVSALFQQAPEAYRLQLEEEFTPFVRESLEDLSQGTLQYFQRHCDISELEQQLQGQAAVLPESQRAPFEDKAAKTVFSLRRAANGAVPQEEHTDQTEQRAAHPVPASREAVPGEMTQPPQQAEGGESPQRSVKVKIRRLKQKQARRPQRPKVHLTPER